jgi:universal stress protein E
MSSDRDYRVILAAIADVAGKGQVAARKAVELAHLMGADVVLYHASYEPSLSGPRFFDAAGLARARREHVKVRADTLDELAERLSSSDVAVRARVDWKKAIPEAVVRAAMSERADLVVAEPRYRGTRRQRFGLSHTDWELIRVCPMPVLFCKTSAPYDLPRIVAAVDPGAHLEHESQLDVNIVATAARIAELTRGSARIVHVLHRPPHLPGIEARAERKERSRVETLLKALARGGGLKAGAANVLSGDPVDALLGLVTAESVDLVVMGTFMRGPVKRVLFGSTAERLLNLAPCDVLVLKPERFLSPVPPPSTKSGRPH